MSLLTQKSSDSDNIKQTAFIPVRFVDCFLTSSCRCILTIVQASIPIKRSLKIR